MALHPGFARIPQRGLDNVQGPNVDFELFTIITPHKIYALKTEHEGQRITLHTLLQAYKYIIAEYDASEAKHWLPLFTSQDKETHILFREALQKDEYCRKFLHHVDNSQFVYSIVLENLIEEKDMHNLMDKVEVINGRLDVTWRGKENMTFNTGEYLINTRDHIDTDGNVNLFYKTMWLTRAF